LKGYRADNANLTVVEGYLALNRNQEAYELAQDLLSRARQDPDRGYQTALSALFCSGYC
jgi:hypothetical protein